MNPGELDSLLERAAELPGVEKLPTDPIELRRWAERSCALFLELRQALRDGVASQGGTLALRLRAALEDKVLAQVNGRAELTTEVTEHTVQVHILPGEVILDIRLKVGKVRDGTASIGGGATE